MKPDKNLCLICKKDISDKRKGARFCSESHRKVYERNPDKYKIIPDNKPDISRTKLPNNPDKYKPDKLTPTDRTFYNRAMQDFGEPYYRFGEIPVTEKTCSNCDTKFKTTLNLLRFCTYKCMRQALGG